MSDEPESIHTLVDWWEKASRLDRLERGALVWAYIPQVSVVPYLLCATGRKDAREHSSANFRMSQLNMRGDKPAPPNPPVAGLPLHSGEQYWVAKAKKRPAIVVAGPGDALTEKFRKQLKGWRGQETYLLAPAFGVDQSGTRGGYPSEFVDRVRACMYPQFLYERFPDSKTVESIVRLDQMFPLAQHHQTFEHSGWQLSEDALDVLGQWVAWFATGQLPEDSELHMIRETLLAEVTA